MVYEPREDSVLLAGVVGRLAYGRVLDMGTGSGVQALAASRRAEVDTVAAVDIDPEAVAAAREAGVEAYASDLFSGVTGTFDTIVCNAPYLPDEPLAPDVALDGGRKGFEWTVRFLSDAASHLDRRGQILLLISTLTNPHVVERHLLEAGLSWEVVATERLSFEELFVYRIVWALPDLPRATYLASGRRSRVYRDGQEALKLSEARRVAQEALMLRRVNALGIGPTLHAHADGRLVMEYVEGPRLDRFLAQARVDEALMLLADVVHQLRVLDEVGIRKAELTNPYKHIIVRDGRAVLIDWERARSTPRAQNLSQFTEYLRRVPVRFPHLASLRAEELLRDTPSDRALRLVRRVPAGRVSTYGDIARAIGSSPRAVGQALRKNPYAPQVPCHRVVAADFGLGGFRGQTAGAPLAEKRSLLSREGVPITDGRVDRSCRHAFN